MHFIPTVGVPREKASLNLPYIILHLLRCPFCGVFCIAVVESGPGLQVLLCEMMALFSSAFLCTFALLHTFLEMQDPTPDLTCIE